jgi:hypothetical protein
MFLSVPAFATHFADDIQSYGQKGDEVTVTFSSHERVHRLKRNDEMIPCLHDAWLARKPVDVTVDDKDGDIINCKLAPRQHPGRAGK